MPAIPSATRQSLQSASPGSLVSVKTPDGSWLLGLRAELPDGRGGLKPAFVSLETRPEGGLIARVTPEQAIDPRDFIAGPPTRVVNHGAAWTLHVDPRDWNPDIHFDYGIAQAGTLLAQEVDPGECGLQLAVAVPWENACRLLNLGTWLIPTIPTQNPPLRFAATRRWALLVPGMNPDATRAVIPGPFPATGAPARA
jgi:hypothetical protein